MNWWKVFKSRIAGRVPTVNQLDLDSIGVNSADGKMFIKRRTMGGVESIVEIGGGGGGGGGAETFLQLADTPASYSGQAGKAAVVNEGETGLEFVEVESGGLTAEDDILDWNINKYTPYATQQSGGKFDNSSTVPTHTSRLNYDGRFYATQFRATGETVEVSGKGRYKTYLLDSVTEEALLTFQTYYWSGSSFLLSYSIGLGINALKNNKALNCTAIGHGALDNNTGHYAVGTGQGSLASNSGNYCVAYGYNSLFLNTGGLSSAFGHYAGRENTGENCNGFGISSILYNTGNRSNAFGSETLHTNVKNDCNAFGYKSLYHNAGLSANSFGNFSSENNSGDNVCSFGHYALYLNSGHKSIAIGNYSGYRNTKTNFLGIGFNSGKYNKSENVIIIGNHIAEMYLDSTSEKSFTDSDIDVFSGYINLPSHGFGTTNEVVYLYFTLVSGTAPEDYPENGVYQFTVVNANTIAGSFPSWDSGSGTFKLSNNIAVENAIMIGHDVEPQKSNQVILGNLDNTEVLTEGDYKSVSGGYILKSPDNSYWRITIANDGTLITTQI